jgi:protocatechuate 3,4-dioxygenase beta subunit
MNGTFERSEDGMDRKDFLKSTGGMIFAAMALKSGRAWAEEDAFPISPRGQGKVAAPDCVLSPAVAEGPYYLPLDLLRQDITEGKPGMPLTYSMIVLDSDCKPYAGAIVDVWQCDKDGIYSGYAGQATGASTLGQTFLRGVQAADANGLVQFTSIYPGWYPNRLTHLHVKIHLGSNVVLTTNLFYPDTVNNEVYATTDYAQHGPNPTTVAQDVELHGDNARFQALTMRFQKSDKGGYLADYTIGIGAAASGIRPPPPGQSKGLRFDHPFPNPMRDATTFKYAIGAPSEVDAEIIDASGAVVQTFRIGKVGAGEHDFVWKSESGRFPPGAYSVRLTAQNAYGGFTRTQRLDIL